MPESIPDLILVLCPECDGTGEIECQECHGIDGCSSCDGELYVVCPLCIGECTITESMAWGWNEAQQT